MADTHPTADDYRNRAERAEQALAEALAENARLREALERLRDCDWVISLPDRMDAVREIARNAFNGRSNPDAE